MLGVCLPPYIQFLKVFVFKYYGHRYEAVIQSDITTLRLFSFSDEEELRLEQERRLRNVSTSVNTLYLMVSWCKQ